MNCSFITTFFTRPKNEIQVHDPDPSALYVTPNPNKRFTLCLVPETERYGWIKTPKTSDMSNHAVHRLPSAEYVPDLALNISAREAARRKRERHAHGLGIKSADFKPTTLRRKHGQIDSSLQPKLLGEGLYELLGDFEHKQISRGGLSHYFLSEVFRRLHEVPSSALTKHPASTHLIESLPPVGALLEETCCSICQTELLAADSTKRMPCGHAFHSACIVPWLQNKNTCPDCRAEVETVCPVYNTQHKAKMRSAVSHLLSEPPSCPHSCKKISTKPTDEEV